jgi:DNA-binding XRE family transcriptional regulator
MPTLKEWRAQRLFTVRGLAEAAGVAATTVYLVETVAPHRRSGSSGH